MYGQNSAVLRVELSRLLRQHRIQYRLGASARLTAPTATTTIAERHELSRLIQRYRLGVLWWCRQGLASAGTGLPGEHVRRDREPSVDLRRYLGRTIEAATAMPPSMAELTTAQVLPLVEAWRRAAAAAALGEHDFADDMVPGRLDQGQRRTLATDVAQITLGLLVLDRRYENVPGWEPLRGPARLERAAEACMLLDQSPDCAVDRRGWRPPARPIDGPARSGIAGVIQAEHNTLVRLTSLPTALNFRRLLDSQRELSHRLAVRVTADEPEVSARWAQRAETYTALQREARNLAGPVGDGTGAVIEATNALARLRQLTPESRITPRHTRDLELLFRRLDERLADVYAHGVDQRLYFTRAPVPHIDDNDGQLVHGPRERFTPITSHAPTALRQLIEKQLRPPAAPVSPWPGSCASRLELSKAITHQPPSRAGELGL